MAKTEFVNGFKSVNEIYEALRKPFDLSCYSVDSSRGFNLTSLRAQYVSIRLNEVLGLENWKFDGEFKETDKGVVFFGELTIKLNNEVSITKKAIGGSSYKKNIGDTYKSAQTDALSKCGSYFGIAEQAFCGLINPEDVEAANEKAGKVKTEVSNTKTKKSFVKKDNNQQANAW